MKGFGGGVMPCQHENEGVANDFHFGKPRVRKFAIIGFIQTSSIFRALDKSTYCISVLLRVPKKGGVSC